VANYRVQWDGEDHAAGDGEVVLEQVGWMKNTFNSENGIIDSARNPFAQKLWIEQGFPLTKHRREQTELLLYKTVEEIRSFDENSGSYPAFVAIRWNYVEIIDNKLSPTAKWEEWQPLDQKQFTFDNVSRANLEEMFSKWLEKIAVSWGVTVQDVALRISADEIKNRVQKYPALQQTLKEAPFDIERFSVIARECWVLGGKYDSVRFNGICQ